MDWSLRDLFVAYEIDLLVWATLAAGGSKVRKPDPPSILQAPKIIIGGQKHGNRARNRAT
jgi:hypothetical protein